MKETEKSNEKVCDKNLEELLGELFDIICIYNENKLSVQPRKMELELKEKAFREKYPWFGKPKNSSDGEVCSE